MFNFFSLAAKKNAFPFKDFIQINRIVVVWPIVFFLSFSCIEVVRVVRNFMVSICCLQFKQPTGSLSLWMSITEHWGCIKVITHSLLVINKCANRKYWSTKVCPIITSLCQSSLCHGGLLFWKVWICVVFIGPRYVLIQTSTT